MNRAINPCAKLTAFRVRCFTIALQLFPITFTFTPRNLTRIPIIGRGNSLLAPRVYQILPAVVQRYPNPSCYIFRAISDRL